MQNKIPKCKIEKNHRYNLSETGICSKCGYDRYDNAFPKDYKPSKCSESLKGESQ